MQSVRLKEDQCTTREQRRQLKQIIKIMHE
jgi:hypothetical protein